MQVSNINNTSFNSINEFTNQGMNFLAWGDQFNIKINEIFNNLCIQKPLENNHLFFQATAINDNFNNNFFFLDQNVSNEPVTKEVIDKVVQRSDLQNVRKELAKRLNDINRVDKIVYDYATQVQNKIPDPKNRELFEQWMIGISYFLGSPYYNHDLFFRHQSQNPFFSNNLEFKIAFDDFVNSIQKHSTPLHNTLKTAKKIKNIAILYPGTGGGGHKAPAMAMAKALEQKGHRVKLLDIDEFEKPYDPKIGGLTRGEIFSKIYQQEGNVAKAYQMWTEGDKKQPIESRRFMKDLSDAIRDFDTDHMFVVAHHQPEHTSIAYQLGIPATYVHTDNEFHANLQDINLNQQELKKPLVSFTALSDQSDFYHNLLTREGKKHYNELPQKVKKQMVRMNFPVRQSFQPVTKKEKMAIRRTLGIDENATVVKLAMGANGIPKDIKDIMERIKKEEQEAKKPIHVLVVCGANKALKDELDQMVKQGFNKGAVKFQILGFLNEHEMSQYDKSSDVWITKPGGSTSAEAHKMRKQMLYVPNHHHLWELTNAQMLEKENLAKELNNGQSLMKQIDERARIGDKVEYLRDKQADWTKQLAKIVDNAASPILSVA